MYFSSLHGHGTSASPSSSGAPTVCRQGTNVAVLAEHVEGGLAHAGHDPHRDRDVGGVGQLDADLGDRRAERAHRERDDVQRAAAHRAVELVAEHARASRPGPASCWSARRPRSRSEQMNVRSSTRATSSGSRRRQVRVRALGVARAARTCRASTSSWHSASYSSAEPSHQWTASGWVSSATSSTQARSLLCLRGDGGLDRHGGSTSLRRRRVCRGQLRNLQEASDGNRARECESRQDDHSAVPKLTLSATRSTTRPSRGPL